MAHKLKILSLNVRGLRNTNKRIAIFFLIYWKTKKPQLITSIIQQWLQLFTSFKGDAFYPLSVWPQEFKLIFRKKTISDKDTFKLCLFLIGNGCSLHLISHWSILTSQHWMDHRQKGRKTCSTSRQLDFLLSNMDNKSHIWFYFDLHCEEWIHLNGQKRTTKK